MSEKALEFTTPDNKAEGETNKAEQGIVYPPEIKAKLDLAMDKITKTEKGSPEELTALKTYQEEISPLTKAREEKEAREALVDFQGEQIHKFELEALEALVVQINKGFAQQRIINKDFKQEDISLDDLTIAIEDNSVIVIRSNATILAGDISKALEALINLKYLGFSSLSSAEGLTLPITLDGNLGLENLTSAKGLTLPTTVNGYLDLSNLISTECLTLPTTVNGDLYLDGLSSAEGLTLPTTVNGILDLRSLSSAEGLTLPTTVNGYLDLSNLISTEGLTLPITLDGNLYLQSLTSDERNELRKKHPSFQIEPED
jgi:hypothetical protein